MVTGKTVKPRVKLTGTIYSVADEVQPAGSKALPIQLDVRDESAVYAGADAAETFGGIDILVNNAGAISLTDTQARR
ncbi:MAG TPA: SDR family NAD(P)-dependent oxidoreductase [Burkholderiales bacterium]|nr:SDR family NAD(P)-dependent oxidoreductase [Burkholderiales bacterium]